MEHKKKPLIVFIGCGGVFYHGLPRMATFLNRRGKCDVLLVDHDIIEERNAGRQWGAGVGVPKVVLASEVLASLTGNVIDKSGKKLESTDQLSEAIKSLYPVHEAAASKLVEKTECKTVSKTPQATDGKPSQIVLLHAPDNHLCRMLAHESAPILAKEFGVPVLDITGGNNIDDGYAYSCWFMPDGKVHGDWLKKHPDIAETAEAERQALEHPMPCGSLVGDRPEQSIESNQLTAFCMWNIAETSWGDKTPVGHEQKWRLDKSVYKITERIVK